MRSYGQYCSVAKALDVIGDRWTLLIVRELLLRGACRYTDLKNGLPGIATNLLADRIRELESAGLVRREEAPPPVATTLVHLTETGAELEPVIKALGWWGIRYMAGPRTPTSSAASGSPTRSTSSSATATPAARRRRSSCGPARTPRSSRCPAARSASAPAPCPARTSSWPGRRS